MRVTYGAAGMLATQQSGRALTAMVQYLHSPNAGNHGVDLMKRHRSPFLFGILCLFFFSTSGFCAITGLTAYPTTVNYAAVQNSTTKLTDSAPLILAAGSGNAIVTVSTIGATANGSGQGCGT